MPKQFVIYGAKQRGRLSHFTETLYTLITILKSQRLQPGDCLEYNPNTQKKGKYIAFSRDLLAATKRSNKWNYGIILDEDRLSENYNITPYSYEWLNNNKIFYRIKTITSYENGLCTVSFVGKNTTEISQSTYNYFRELVLKYPRNKEAKLDPPRDKDARRRKINGTYIKEKFNYNSMQGGPKISYSNLPLELKPFVDEYEERFWATSKQSFIKLDRSMIQGIILPRSDKDFFEFGDDSDMQLLRNLMDDICGKDNYNVMYY